MLVKQTQLSHFQYLQANQEPGSLGSMAPCANMRMPFSA